MRAVVYDRYGPPEVLRLEDVADPVPKAGEVRVRIRATTVTSGDRRARSLDMPFGFGLVSHLFFGIRRPRQRILGTELAGDVDAVGAGVRAYAVGDAVFAFGGAAMGCHAEFRCMPEDGALARKPPSIRFEEAAALSFGGTTALHFLRKAALRGGERVLVNGASGGVGTAAVQLAKHFGAHVTGVRSAANADFMRSLGADAVLDYAKEDFTRSGETYDVVMDTVGTAGYARAKRSLRKGGRLLLVFAKLSDMLRIPWAAMAGRARIVAGPAGGTGEDLRFLARLAAAGAFRPVIDRRYPLEQAVEAHRYVDSGRKRGNVVLTVTRPTGSGPA